MQCFKPLTYSLCKKYVVQACSKDLQEGGFVGPNKPWGVYARKLREYIPVSEA